MIVVGMKFLSWGLVICGVLSGAQLKDVKSVYFYPMTGGFDQLLADQIVTEHIFKVVPDPKLADAVFTDELSELFLYKLDHIQTPPAAAKTSGSTSSMGATETAPHPNTFTRGRGTVFLVDIKSKQVIWSAFQKPRNKSADQLHNTAKKVVKMLGTSIVEPAVPH
jgi:hypothetical protein